LAHAFGSSYIAQGSCDKLRITILKCSFQICRYIISSGKVFDWVPDCRGSFGHWTLLEVSSKIFGEANILVLRTLVAAYKQNEDGVSKFCQINPIAVAVMDPQLRDTISYGADIS